MAATQQQSYLGTSRTLLGIPPELRLKIFDYVFEDITVTIERGPVNIEEEQEEGQDGSAANSQDEHVPSDDDDEGEHADNDVEVDSATQVTNGITELPKVPRAVVTLKLVCRTFAVEIGDDWHSKVLYKFPSTVAFIDVLSQWSQEQIQSLRKVHVLDTPLPLYPFGGESYYTTHQFSDCLPMFPGLQLDLLIVENIWLEPNGEEIDGWCLGATFHAIKGLAGSKGWRELHYKTGILGLNPKQMRSVDEIIQKQRDSLEEPDLALFWGRNRPQLSGLITYHVDGTQISNDKDEDVQEVERWYVEHPEEGNSKSFPQDVLEKDNHFQLRRGCNAKYVQDGEGRTKVIKSLLDNTTWVELRATGEYLIDDGLEDPCAHL